MNVIIAGYGSQAVAQAHNVRDSGWGVTILLRPDSPSIAKAQADRFAVSTDPATALRDADYLLLLIGDTAQPSAWNIFAPHLTARTAIVFAHGFNLHYRTIVPPPQLDVLLLAPMCPGAALRTHYQQRTQCSLITAIAHDASGAAARKLAALAMAVGTDCAEIIPSSIAEETETNLFAEQALLIGGLSHLIQATYDTMTATGYNPRLAMRWCLDDMRDCAALFAAHGLPGAYQRISPTAAHGGATRGPRIIDARVRETLQTILQEIRSGHYADELRAADDARPAVTLTTD